MTFQSESNDRVGLLDNLRKMSNDDSFSDNCQEQYEWSMMIVFFFVCSIGLRYDVLVTALSRYV
jgi:hypothetical protein